MSCRYFAKLAQGGLFFDDLLHIRQVSFPPSISLFLKLNFNGSAVGDLGHVGLRGGIRRSASETILSFSSPAGFVQLMRQNVGSEDWPSWSLSLPFPSALSGRWSDLHQWASGLSRTPWEEMLTLLKHLPAPCSHLKCWCECNGWSTGQGGCCLA